MDADIFQTELEAVTPELANAAAASDLTPAGTFDGVLLDYTVRVSDFAPFEGKQMVRAHIELYDCPAGSGRTKHHYFTMTPSQGFTEGGMLRSESREAAKLAKYTGTVGASFTQALEAAKVMRLRYRITQSAAKDGYDPRNWTSILPASK